MRIVCKEFYKKTGGFQESILRQMGTNDEGKKIIIQDRWWEINLRQTFLPPWRSGISDSENGCTEVALKKATESD